MALAIFEIIRNLPFINYQPINDVVAEEYKKALKNRFATIGYIDIFIPKPGIVNTSVVAAGLKGSVH
jgi:hypothetical protein